MKDIFLCLSRSPRAANRCSYREDIEGEALATLVVNKLRARWQVAAVKAGIRRSSKEMCRTSNPHGREGITEDLGIKLENVKMRISDRPEDHIDKDNTTIIEGKANTPRRRSLGNSRSD